MKIDNYIREIENFPKQGIIFKDIAPLLASPEALSSAIDEFVRIASQYDIDKIGGYDSRGFLFGPLLAQKMHKPFFMIRKAGKLPGTVISQNYDLEYGNATIEIQVDAINPGEKILLIDDLLATGGTAAAGADLVERSGGEVSAIFFVIALRGIGGHYALKEYCVHSLTTSEVGS